MANGTLSQGFDIYPELLNPRRFQAATPLLVLAVATGAAAFAKPWLGEGYASLIFVVGIMLIGTISGLTRAVTSAVIGSVMFNFFIAEPVLDFRFTSSTDFAPLLVFVLCAVISGSLSGRLRDQSRRALQANTRLESLLDVSRDLQSVRSPRELRDTLLDHVARQPDLSAVLCWQNSGRMHPLHSSPAIADEDARAASEPVPDGHQRPALQREPITDGHETPGCLVYAQDGTQHEDSAYVVALGRLGSLALTRLRLDTEVSESRALVRSEELKTALLSSVSHDLRTPLTSISTAASSLLTFANEIDSATRDDLLGNIVDECERLNHLTENLLQMTRLQVGPTHLSRSMLCAQDMIRRCIARQRPQAGARDFVVDAPRDDVMVMADTALFELALTNVLQNAVKYSADATLITVVCHAQAADCVIAITDQGIGVPVDEQYRVFERFYRAGRQLAGPKGSGLGLAIAKGFVEASGGTIALASPVRDGHGTTVTIHLPLAPEQRFS